MAIGFSGSNGGIQDAYKHFVLTDVDAGITKYEELHKRIPESEKKPESFINKQLTD